MRDSQTRTVRRERNKWVVTGWAESNDTTVTINDPSAHTFARWVEGVVGETSHGDRLPSELCSASAREAHETLIGNSPAAIAPYDKMAACACAASHALSYATMAPGPVPIRVS